MKIHANCIAFGDDIIVKINDPTDGMDGIRQENRVMLSDWCAKNCKGKYRIGLGYGSFEFQEDAILFKLTWS